jgi:prepilin-type processing-associated H-X9-DG protein
LSEVIMSNTTTASRPQISGMALAGLLFGLLAPFTFVTAPFALYFSYRGLYAVNASAGQLAGRRAALAGLFLGGLGLLMAVIGTFALIVAKLQTTDNLVDCKNNLRVVGVAVNQYRETHEGVFPRAVVPLEGHPPEKRASWLAAVLPFIEVKPNHPSEWAALASRLNLEKPWDDPANREALTFHVPYYQCPGNPAFDPHNHPGLTTYPGVAGVGEDAASLPKDDPRAGFFGYNRNVTLTDVLVKSDDKRLEGSSHKMMVVETTWQNGNWIAGGPPTVRGVPFDPAFLNRQGATLVGLLAGPEGEFGARIGAVLQAPRPEEPALIGPGRPFGGCHEGGLNVLWADGSVRWVNQDIDPRIFRLQATLSDDPQILYVLP